MGRLIKYSQSFENKNASLLAKTLAKNLYRQEGIVNPIMRYHVCTNIGEEIESLKMDFVMSEELDMNDLVTSCF